MCRRFARFTRRCYLYRRWNKKLLTVVFILAVIFGFTRIRQESLIQEDLDYMAASIKVHFEILSKFETQVTISNSGPKPFKNAAWTIFFSVASPILPHLFPQYPDLQEDPLHPFKYNNSGIAVNHVLGRLYKLEPVTDLFTPELLTCTIRALPLMLWSRFIICPNWYITANGLKPRVIASTANEDLDFVSSSESLRWNTDSYDAGYVSDLGHAPLPVIPTPREMTSDASKTVSIGKEWTVFGDDGLQNEINFLAGKLDLRTSSSKTKSKTILLLLNSPSDTPKQFSSTANEFYNLQVDNSRELITITGQAPAGVFYGVQTLLALVKDSGEVTELTIKDSPRFSYRGLMVDVARNFQPKHEILKLLDVMAMYKMNKLHFHLSDSEAWRLEIPGLDELTTVGSKRCHDLQEKRCILSQLGSGPFTNTSGTGYYSTEDYREILRHATARHIQVIPEFDFPGHSHAAIKSMIARHDRLMQQGKEHDAKAFLLSDPEDKSQYITVQAFTDDAVNPCLQSTYTFLHYVLATLSRLHGDIQPLTLFHFGGDEVAEGVWEGSPECHKQALKGNYTITKRVLMKHFVQNFSRVAQKYGLDLGGWNDAFSSRGKVTLHRATMKSNNTVVYFWGTINEEQTISSLLREGYKVVLSPPKYLYLDHSPRPDFDERGLDWATKFTSLRKIFTYSPLEHQNIMGLEGAMWGELVRTADQMYSIIFPRLLALAERAWHKGSWQDLSRKGTSRDLEEEWVNFINTLGHRELGRLDKMGVAYRVPPPVARIICKEADCRLHVTAPLPGLKVEGSTDNGQTWSDVTPETEVKTEIQLRTRSADQNRFSRVIRL